ncbi:TPA: hypothetical protein EYP26_02375, partial [Candidatus Bathyarchaeota archaeon]|nr:hypothetical protein [Candidatus Bathyarchaeota archaeon]
MSSGEKVSRRKYIVAAGAAVAAAVIGGAAYYLARPPPPAPPERPWERIEWNEPPMKERLTGLEVGSIPDHWIERFPTLKTYGGWEGIGAIDGYELPEGWEKAVEGVDKLRFLNYGGLPHDPATQMAMCKFEDLTGIKVEAREMEELTLWLKTVAIMTAKSDAIDFLHIGGAELMTHTVMSGWAVPVDFLWPPEVQELYSPLAKSLLYFNGHWWGSGMVSTKPFCLFWRIS